MYSNSQNDFKREVEHKVSSKFLKLSHQGHNGAFQYFYPEISFSRLRGPWISNLM